MQKVRFRLRISNVRDVTITIITVWIGNKFLKKIGVKKLNSCRNHGVDELIVDTPTNEEF